MPIGTTIDGLNAVTSLTTNDEVPVWDKEASGEPTKKITAQNLASSVKTLADLQGALTFDSTPTAGSTNPVTSGGIADAIAQSTAALNQGIGIGGGRVQTTLSSLYMCTGTVIDRPYVAYAGDYAYVMGRLTIDGFSRTGGNPGAILTLPSGKKIADGFFIYANGCSANSSGIRPGEEIIVQADTGGTTFSLTTTESYTNVSGTRVYYLLAPFVIKVK